MITYHPIDCGASWDADWCDFRTIDLESGIFEWSLERSEIQSVRVQFCCDFIVRILDELALSTESSPAEWRGLTPHHFAYEVEGDPFMTSQSEVWLSLNPGAKHYRFLTGSWCLDVVATNPPSFVIG